MRLLGHLVALGVVAEGAGHPAAKMVAAMAARRCASCTILGQRGQVR
jgi:hypothetical protein